MALDSVVSNVRRTAADEVYECLHSDIVTLRLLPGDKLSEVDVSRQHDVSRQPVREAFIRLHNAGLLRVQPQKATEVRRISEQSIRNSRFVRLAVEIEVLRKACNIAPETFHSKFVTNLKLQKKAIDAGIKDNYHDLDYEFHHLICQSADCKFAFATIEASKSHVDRLCLLALSDPRELHETYDDHCQLVECIIEKKEERAVQIIRHHLQRLDTIIDSVKRDHADYFENH